VRRLYKKNQIVYYFLPLVHFTKRYARGAAIKIDDNVPATIPAPITNANVLIIPVPNTHIITTIINAAIDVPNDLLIVCHSESSKIWRYVILHVLSAHSWSLLFSLTLSKIMIVSLILYHMIVRIAAINTKSTCVVGCAIVSSPYNPAGIEISNSNVTIVIIANTIGDTISLTAENVNII
jgi:hypothetical protein